MLFNEPTFHLIQKIATKEQPHSTELVSLDRIFSLIQNAGEKTTSQVYDRLRKIGNKNSDDYKKIKNKEIHSWFPHSTFIKGSSFAERNVQKLTGYLYFDVDAPTLERAQQIKEELAKNPHIIACWLSAGGNGIGCLIQVDGLTKQNFKGVYHQIGEKHFHSFNDCNKPFDDACGKPERKNCIGYDKEIYINNSAIPYKPDFDIIPNLIGSIKPSKYNKVDRTGTPNKVANTEKEGDISKLTGGNEIPIEQVLEICLAKREVWPEPIKKISFLEGNQVLAEDCENNLPYVFHEEKKMYYNAFNRFNVKGQTEVGNRTTKQFSKGCSMMLNNEKLIKKFGIWSLAPFFKWFNSLNYVSNTEPLSEREIIGMIHNIYNLLLSGDLYSNYGKEKRIAWKKGNNLSAKQKKSISAKLIRNHTKQTNKNKIILAFNSFAKENLGEIPTQNQIKELTGLSINTIAQYWKELTVKTSNNQNKTQIKMKRIYPKPKFMKREKRVFHKMKFNPDLVNWQMKYYNFEEVIKNSFLLDDWSKTWNVHAKAFYDKEIAKGNSFEHTCRLIYYDFPFEREAIAC